MPRSRIIVVDADNSWIIREELILDPSDAPQDDYIIVQTGFPVYSNAHTFYTQIVIWGVGLVSFGPVTPAQTAFMASLGAAPDLAAFPGDYVAFGFSATQLEHFQYGVKAGYLYVTSDVNPMIQFTIDGISVFGATTPDAFFGMDFGGFLATANPSAGVFYSDLDVTSGNNNANTMIGSSGPETLLGLGGNDHLIGNDGGDRLDGGAGKDLVEGGAGNDRLYGGIGDDVVRGGTGHDRLFGGDGNDLLDPGSGSDSVDGGAGTDRLVLDFGASTKSLYFQFQSGSPIATPDGSVTAVNVEELTVYGGNYSDVIIGTGFADKLYGGNGFDLLQGGAGKDFLDGGVNSGSAAAIIPGAADTREAALPIDHFFTLNDDPDIGDSTTLPHATLNVHAQTSQFEFTQETHHWIAITVTQVGATLTADVDHSIFQIDTQIAVYDSTGLLLTSNDNGASLEELDPGSTNPADSLLTYTFGAAGTYYVDVVSLINATSFSWDFEVNYSLTSASVPVGDVMEGGSGSDIYVVHSASDTVVELAGGGTDTVQTDLSHVLGANVEWLELTGTAAVDGTGNALVNKITGNSAANVLTGLGGGDLLNGGGGIDTIDGGAGTDRLNGGIGNDLLTGGSGNDKFVFDSALNGSTNVDQLIDFNAAQDKIVLDHTIFTALASGSLAAAGFFAGAAAHDATDRIVYDSASGNIYYDADGDGAAAQVLFAHVAAGTALTNTDFLIVP